MSVTVWEIRGHVASGKILKFKPLKWSQMLLNLTVDFRFCSNVISFVQTFVLNTTNLKFESIYFNENHCFHVFTHIHVSFSRIGKVMI